MPRWRHCLVTAILFVAVVLHASTGQPPFLRKGRSPLFLWAAPSKDVPTLRIHGGTLAQGKGREHCQWLSSNKSCPVTSWSCCFSPNSFSWGCFRRFHHIITGTVQLARWGAIWEPSAAAFQPWPRSRTAIPDVGLGATSMHRQIRGAKMLECHTLEWHSCSDFLTRRCAAYVCVYHS